MKLHKLLVIAIFLVLVVDTNCGIIDNIYGNLKNTTSGLKQDVKNVWIYSKGVVGLQTENPNMDSRPEEERRGLIGGMVHSTREKVHSVRNYFWNSDELSTDAGLFGNMYNRVKNRLVKIKGSILGEDPKIGETTPPPSEQTKVIRDTLNKLFFGNGTRSVHGRKFQETIENLRRKLQEMRNNMTVSTTKSPVHHGEGMIDVRLAGGIMQESFNDSTVALDNDVYEKIDDGMNEIRNQTEKSYKNVKDNVDKGVNVLRNGVDSATNQLNGLKEKTSDSMAKQNEMLGNGYNKLNVNANNISDNVKNMIDDAKRFS